MSEKFDLVGTELLIGQQVTIHLLKKQQSVTGLVLNETRNTLIIQDQQDNKQKMYPKTDSIMVERSYHGKSVLITGSILKGRPEERLKAEPRKKW